MTTWTVAQFHAALKAQGVPMLHLAFVCPRCGTVQSAASLIRAGVGPDLAAVDRFRAFSCVGRWTQAQGCDWTLGGLLQLHRLEVVTPDDQAHPCFEVATTDQAQALMVHECALVHP